MYGFIYVTTNLVNGKRYVGKCSYKRSCWKTYLGSGKWLLKAIKKYGVKNFSREVIEECATPRELTDRENYYIDLYNAAKDNQWYNIYSLSTTNQSFLGKKHTPERNAIVSAKLKGRKRPQHVKDALSKAHKGKTLSEKQRKQISERMSSNHPTANKVVWEGVEYPSVMSAMKATGLSRKFLDRLVFGTPPKYNHKPVVINGIHYESISHAMRELKWSRPKIKDYVKGHE